MDEKLIHMAVFSAADTTVFYLNETPYVVVGMSFAMRLGGGPRREPED